MNPQFAQLINRFEKKTVTYPESVDFLWVMIFSWVWMHSGNFSRSGSGYACIVGNLSGSNSTPGVVWQWSLLRVDPGLNSTKCGHGVQCGATTSHSTYCGCCFSDYHICFRMITLSSLSVPTLYLNDPRRGLTWFRRIFFWRSGDTSG